MKAGRRTMTQRRLTTKQLLAVNDRAKRAAELCSRRGLPVPTYLGEHLAERLDPAGEHTALYAQGVDCGRSHDVVIAVRKEPRDVSRYAAGPRFRQTQVVVRLLGVSEPYSTRLDMTQEDFDSLPPADVHFDKPPPVATTDDDFVGRQPKPVSNGKNGPEDYDEEHHKGHMGRYVETVEQHTAACCSCRREYTMDSISLAQFLNELYADGWRLAASEYLETKGLMCEGCYASRDTGRGVCDAR